MLDNFALWPNIAYLLPHGFLAVWILLMLLWCAAPKASLSSTATFGAVGVLLAALWFNLTGSVSAAPWLMITPVHLVVGSVLLGAAAVHLRLLAGWFNHHDAPHAKGELALLLVLSSLGLWLATAAQNYLLLYLAMELATFPLYVLLASQRTAHGTEAALKYFILSSVAAAIFLLGFALLSVQMPLFGSILMLVAFLFKLGIFPFHFAEPDAYAGAPMPVAAYMATVPKLAFAVVLFQLFAVNQNLLSSAYVLQGLMFMAVATLLFGAFTSLGQNNLKRLMAYSGIGHMGFALLAILAKDMPSLLLYLAIYLPTTLGIFACFMVLEKPNQFLSLESLRGLGKSRPTIAYSLSVLFFSLAGIPPLAGFFAKFAVLQSAAGQGWWWLVAVALLASAIALFYSLYILRMMFFDEPNLKRQRSPMSFAKVVAVVCTLWVLVAGFFSEHLLLAFS